MAALSINELDRLMMMIYELRQIQKNGRSKLLIRWTNESFIPSEDWLNKPNVFQRFSTDEGKTWKRIK